MSFDVSKISLNRKGEVNLITIEQNPEFAGALVGDFNLLYGGKKFARNILITVNEDYKESDKKSPNFMVALSSHDSFEPAGTAYKSKSKKTGSTCISAFMNAPDNNGKIKLTMFDREGSDCQIFDIGSIEKLEDKQYNSTA